MTIFKRLFGERDGSSRPSKKPPQFVRTRQTPSGIYEDYTAVNAETAREFLMTKTVSQPKYYIKVVTPEGNWGMDIEGLYLERLLPFQLNIGAAECEGIIHGFPKPFSIKMVVNGVSDNFIVEVGCGKCGQQWSDGIRYQEFTVVRCPNCQTLNKIDSRNIRVVS
jgi:hypothetical protein